MSIDDMIQEEDDDMQIDGQFEEDGEDEGEHDGEDHPMFAEFEI